jgi:hypothetical protein
MSKNIGMYAALLQGIVIGPGDHIITPRMFRRNVYKIENALAPLLYDPLGRRIRALAALRGRAAGIYLQKSSAPAVLLR